MISYFIIISLIILFNISLFTNNLWFKKSTIECYKIRAILAAKMMPLFIKSLTITFALN